MPKVKISEYSATANSNTDVASINIDEGCAPSGINNAIRAVMGHLKDFQQGTNGDPFNGPHNGTVGATTPSTGAFTTLSATGAVSFTSANPSLSLGNGNASAGSLRFNPWTATNYNWSIDNGVITAGTLSITPSTAVGGNTYTTPVAAFSTTGLAVTGTLSATGDSAFGAPSTAGFRLYAKGASATSSDFALVIQNSTPTSLLTVRNDGQLGFGVSATAMTLNASGGLQTLNTIGVGNATPSTSGAGITFPATQSASSDANTLDDYEEGLWTPVVSFGGGSTGITGSFVGKYTKIGRQVFGYCTLAFSSKGSSTGAMSVAGLPFTSGTVSTFAVPAGFISNLALALQLQSWINESATAITIQKMNLTATANVVDTDIANNTRIDLSFSYIV